MRFRFFAALVCCSLAPHAKAQTCEEEGVCLDNKPKCGFPRSFCKWDAKKSTMYQYGGTAQAYSPGAPLSDSVCDPQQYQNTPHRVAGWPFHRSNHRSSPVVYLQINLWSCQVKDSASTHPNDSSKPLSRSAADESSNNSKCCCDPLKAGRAGEYTSDSVPSGTIEIWQARPDGSYSSPRAAVTNSGSAYNSSYVYDTSQGDCRGRVHLERGSSSVSIITVAPGSTGALQGLGPNRWDCPPFGPPLLHLLATAPGHAPTLFDLPLLFHRKTLKRAKRSMLGGDWRGSAWMREDPPDRPYDVRKWVGLPKQNRIEVNVNVYLTRLPRPPSSSSSTATSEKADGSSVSSSLWCPSLLYGLPSSFFLEPIAVCARPLLDFFAL